MPTHAVPAIVVSGSTAGLGVIRSLGEKGIPIIVAQFDDRDIGHHSKYVNAVHRVSVPDVDEEGFAAELERIGARFPGALLVPAHDAAVAAVSRHHDRLSQILTVACPTWDVARLYIDKRETYRLAASVGVAVPKTIAFDSDLALEQALDEIGLPLLVKPAQGHLFMSVFGCKMIEVASASELRTTVARTQNAGLRVMLQEIIPGPDSAGANYNSYVVDGRAVAEFTARKVRNSPSRWGSPRVAVSQRIEEVMASGRRVLAAIGYQGFSCTEWKRDERDGAYRLMEVNGRHNLSSMLAVRCGVDFPWIEYRHRVLRETVEPGAGFEEGRYWIDLVRDLGTSMRARKSEGYGLKAYAQPYVSKRCFAIGSWRDPAPMLARILDVVRNGRR